MVQGKIRTNTDYDQEHDSKIEEVLSDFSVRESKVVIIDADSLLYISSYTGKDEEGVKFPEYVPEQYHIAEDILTENIMRILGNIEEFFDVVALYICVKGNNNFRYSLFSDYKANRPPSLPIITHLREYLITTQGAIQAHGFEADDLVYSISETIEHSGIICAVDKDLHQIPSVFYNYCKNEWKRVQQEEARYNFAVQMIIGDAGDGVNFTPKHGIKYAEKVLRRGMSDFAYLRQVIAVFKKCWNKEWKEKLQIAYTLLKLHKVEPLLLENKIKKTA